MDFKKLDAPDGLAKLDDLILKLIGDSGLFSASLDSDKTFLYSVSAPWSLPLLRDFTF